MKNKIVTIAAIQSTASSSPQINLRKTIKMAEEAIKKGAQIICLGELYRTIYFPQYKKVDKNTYAETVPGESTREFSVLAKKHGVVIIVPVFEKRKTGYFNSAVVINHTGKLLPTYDKIHIPQDPGFYEKDYFEESDIGYKIYKTKFATFAVLICYDQWFPEAARIVRLMGAEMIFYPTALGDIIGYKHPNDFHDGWETVIRGHAVVNSLAVVAVNRVGIEGRMNFFGHSFIADAWGKVLKKAPKNKDKVLVGKIDLEYNKFLAEGWGFLRNRRPDTYEVLTSNKLVSKSKNLKNIKDYQDGKKALAGK